MIKNIYFNSLIGAAAIVAMVAGVNLAFTAQEATVITLTQTACQFVESENGVDHRFRSARKADCESINGETGAGRLAQSKVLELKPGKYIFRVINKNVPYDLGFWLRGSGFGRVTLPSVAGGGLALGTTSDFAVELKEGEYFYSCPLNSTPDYRLVVSG